MKSESTLREGLCGTASPDPGFWVCFRGEKFYADANVVYIEGHEEDITKIFAFPGEVKLLQSYPCGVRVTDGFGTGYFLIPDTFDPDNLMIECLTPEVAYRLDYQWREFNGNAAKA